MRSILESCQPRPDIVTGAFNPEIFTANLGQVIDFYRGRPAIIHSLYTDGDQFFKDATYPTENLKLILADVLAVYRGITVSRPSIDLKRAFIKFWSACVVPDKLMVTRESGK
jgi:hypothetical protein